ncbi:MAG TPA: hypothetical protein VMP03_15255 [Methylomirabilota bacterium]|nr:hypothetical protein [Methylomirabilota bacterium]
MTAPLYPASSRHAAGLAFAVALAGVVWLAWQGVGWLIRGTMVQDLRLVLQLVASFGVLSAGEAIWTRNARS